MKSKQWLSKRPSFISCAAVVGLSVFCLSADSVARTPSRGLPGKYVLPFVQISAVSVVPGEVRTTGDHKQAAPVVLVQIFHEPLAEPQTVTLYVGTYSTSPITGVSAVYDPPGQTVTIPKGPSAAVDARARVLDIDIGTNSVAKLTIAATLARPSSGIRVERPSSPGNYRAVLTVRKR